MKKAFFTMDVEDYKDIILLQGKLPPSPPSMMDGMKRFVEMMREENIPITFFFLSSTLKENKDSIIKSLKEEDAIGIHGLEHSLVGEMSEERFEKEIGLAKKEAESILGKEALGYRAPGFDLTDEKLKSLQKLGFLYDSSKFDNGERYPMFDHRLNLQGFNNKDDAIYERDGFFEFSMPIAEGFMEGFGLGGGAYPRFFPYIDYKASLKRYLKKHDTFVFYCHPFEFSKARCPKIKGLSFPLWYYTHVGRWAYLRRAKKIISFLKKEGFSFETMESYAKRNSKV